MNVYTVFSRFSESELSDCCFQVNVRHENYLPKHHGAEMVQARIAADSELEAAQAFRDYLAERLEIEVKEIWLDGKKVEVCE